ncbi:MAG TPA: hypothetical protein VMG60_11580 [Burkholderiaceae bacterium]|nr:hypothetical protein [Burkholderiaceae bacterium]
MIQVQRSSLATSARLRGEADQAPATVPTAASLDAVAGDGRANFDVLFGSPSVQRFYADSNGGGGNTRSSRTTDPLVGVALPGQKDVTVQRSFGDPRGYETRNHAIAWARAAGSDRAMVVRGNDGRWHAVETSVVGKDADKGTGAVKTAIQVGKVDQAQYDALKADAMRNNDPAKWKTFAAYALGLPESEINVIGKGDTPASDKVNINLSPDFDAEGRTAGFDPKRPAWVQLGPAAFDRPANAVSTLAHEEVHAEHRRLTGEIYKKYAESAHGSDTFRQWAAKHIKDVRSVDIVAGYEDGTTAATELEAHVEAARVSFASGDLTQARTDLNKVATLRNLPLLQTQLPSIEALKTMRDSLPPDARKVFDEVAGKANRKSVLNGL